MLARVELPFFGSYIREHGADALLADFFDADGDLLPDAPDELREEVAIIRGEKEPTTV